jgi:hypothetical protein
MASVTHWVSQLLLQQKESDPQTWVAHGSQPEVRAAPDAHGECAHVSGAPEVDVALVAEDDVVVVFVPVDAPPPPVVWLTPHGFVVGMHT